MDGSPLWTLSGMGSHSSSGQPGPVSGAGAPRGAESDSQLLWSCFIGRGGELSSCMSELETITAEFDRNQLNLDCSQTWPDSSLAACTQWAGF